MDEFSFFKIPHKDLDKDFCNQDRQPIPNVFDLIPYDIKMTLHMFLYQVAILQYVKLNQEDELLYQLPRLLSILFRITKVVNPILSGIYVLFFLIMNLSPLQRKWFILQSNLFLVDSFLLDYHPYQFPYHQSQCLQLYLPKKLHAILQFL